MAGTTRKRGSEARNKEKRKGKANQGASVSDLCPNCFACSTSFTDMVENEPHLEVLYMENVE